MKKGFKLTDGSIWTIISYETVEGYEDKLESEIPLSAITVVTGVKWVQNHTHTCNACFSDCNFEDFNVNDPRILELSSNVFSL